MANRGERRGAVVTPPEDEPCSADLEVGARPELGGHHPHPGAVGASQIGEEPTAPREPVEPGVVPTEEGVVRDLHAAGHPADDERVVTQTNRLAAVTAVIDDMEQGHRGAPARAPWQSLGGFRLDRG